MSFDIRPARAGDVPLVESWTRDTFTWGDYVAEALPDWLDDPKSLVMVCVQGDDVPIALSRVQLLSPTEAWLSAARVHPDHRRSGVGTAMNDFAAGWARDRGALVARLATEEDNEPARSQVLKLGYRLTGLWGYATAPAPTGRRLDANDRLKPGGAVDADAAWTFWSQSDLAHAGRDLIALGWRWRRARSEDLQHAVDTHTFYQSPGGWLIAENEPEAIFVRWLATAAPDAPLLFQGMRDLLRDESKGEVGAMVPVTAWTTEALQREGFGVRPIQIFSKSL